MNLFGDMSTPPDLNSPSESNEILLVDLNTDIDTNQNCVKGNPFLSNGMINAFTSLPHPKAQPPFSPENPFSATLSFFPVPNPDPFRDDPFAAQDQSAFSSAHDLNSVNQKRENVTVVNGSGTNGALANDTEFGQQFDQISNQSSKQEAKTDQWPFKASQSIQKTRTPNGVLEHRQNGCHSSSKPNPFAESSPKGVDLQNGIKRNSDSSPSQKAESVNSDPITISPPPQSAKPGRGRRCVKPSSDDIFGSDLFSSSSVINSEPASSVSLPAQTLSTTVNPMDLFKTPSFSGVTATGPLGTLPVSSSQTQWNPLALGFTQPIANPVVNVQTGFNQPSVLTTPQPIGSWNQPANFIAPPPVQNHPALWNQPVSIQSHGWPQQQNTGNPFQVNMFPPTPPTLSSGLLQSGSAISTPPQPPPRPAPLKETPQKESDAFTALDPLGEKEKKNVKDMFKDYQLTKPPAVPARRGEHHQNNVASASGAFSSYFNSKVGIPQENADHDDFDIKQISSKINEPPKPAPRNHTMPVSKPMEGLFEYPFGSEPFNASLQNSKTQHQITSSDPFGDPFGNPFA